MIELLKTLFAQTRCRHDYRYSRSVPGTLVCKRCRKRQGKPKG